MQLQTTPPQSTLASPISHPQTQAKGVCLSLLLILFPFALALALTPLLVGMAFLAMGLIAYKTACLRAFLTTLGIAFALIFFFPTPAAIYCDADHFHLPAIRIIAGAGDVQPLHESGIWWTHFRAALPDGFHRCGAALYHITGWVDAVNILVFILFVPAWITWRQHVGRYATLLILLGPVVFASCFNPLPDGATYLLLVTALGAILGRQLNLALAAMLVASTFKVTAWIPSLFMAGVLLYQYPRYWRRILAIGIIAIVYNLGFFIQHFSGEALPSSDFAAMKGPARALSWGARFVYAYLGHWLIPGNFNFNVPVGGFDGGGIDGLGPIFRCLTWISIGITLLLHKRLKPYFLILFICWGSSLCIPTLYMGYARYVPCIYLAVMLPFILLIPRLSFIPAILVCFLPLAWIGWRIILISERLFVLDPSHTECITSDVYNLQCVAREMSMPLKTFSDETLQPSGSLMYAYRHHRDIMPFPAIPRTYQYDQRLRPAHQKIADVAQYIGAVWLPWSLCNLHKLGMAAIHYRFKSSFTFPRGKYDTQPLKH